MLIRYYIFRVSKKNLTSFHWPIILAVLIEITWWKMNIRTSLFNRMGLYSTEKGQYQLISWESAREMDQAWWRWRQYCDDIAATVPKPVPMWFLFFYMWRDWPISPLFLLALTKSSWESLPQWIMLPKTCYSMFHKSLTANLMCAVSKEVHIFNTYKISPRINLWCSTHKLFNSIELD